MIRLLALWFIGIGVFQIADAKNIRLITIGSGDEFWSAFGHTAIAIDNDVYGFGYFSFADEDLIQSFVNNEMDYDLGVSDLAEEIELAEWQNRTFVVQNLSLSVEEETGLIQYLNWHNLPENQSYRYDYFINNCSTKIRDILNDLWGGELKKKFNALTDQSYFSQTFPAKNQSMMNFGLVLGYGWHAYQPKTSWELMAFPVYLQQKMNEFDDAKVLSEDMLFVAKAESGWLVLMKTHGFLGAYFVFFSLLLGYKKTRAFVARSIWVYQSLIGWAIVYFMVFSGHEVTSLNFNFLLFSPVAWLLFKFHWAKYLMAFSYAAWAVIAIYLQAWYFFPVLVLHLVGVLPEFKLRPRPQV